MCSFGYGAWVVSQGCRRVDVIGAGNVRHMGDPIGYKCTRSSLKDIAIRGPQKWVARASSGCRSPRNATSRCAAPRSRGFFGHNEEDADITAISPTL